MSEMIAANTAVKLYEYNFDKPELDNIFLEHHGVDGQKWGVQNGPPYPLDSDVSTGKSLKKKSRSGGNGKISRKRRKALKKARKTRAANAKRRIQEQAQQKSKEEIMRTKDLKAMAKNIDQFTDKDIENVLNRLDTEGKLHSRIKAIEKANMSTGQKIKEGIKENIKKGAASAGSSMVRTVTENALKMGTKALLKETVGQGSEDLERLIDQLFREKKK